MATAFRDDKGVYPVTSGPLDIQAIRGHFAFPGLGRLVANNAASTQPPRALLALYESLAAGYDNVHRGQSSYSQRMTALFEDAYDTIAAFIGAPGAERGHGRVVSASRAVVESPAAFDAPPQPPAVAVIQSHPTPDEIALYYDV
jgi:hypothetical protein